jgi:hypothetical protein
MTVAIDAGMGLALPIYPSTNAEKWSQYTSQSTVFVESDAADPLSPPGVTRIRFPQGFGGGSAPGKFSTEATTFPTNSGKLYMRMLLKISPNWSDNGNAGTKIIFTRSPNEQLNHYLNLSYSGACTLGYNTQQTGGGARNMQASGAEVDDGAYHDVELVLLPNTPGVANGTVQLWKDGILSLNQTNVEIFASGQTARWTWVYVDPTYGGGFNPVPANQDMTFGHIYVSVG